MIRPIILPVALLLAVAACDRSEPAQTPAAPAAGTPAAPATETPAPTPAGGPNVLTAAGWGPLSVGMTLTQVTEALGPDADPEAVGGAEPGICDQFRPERAPEGTLVMMENGRLSRISLIRGSTTKTERGFGVGSTAAEIKAAYGGAVVSQPHKYAAAPAEDLFVWSNGGSTGYVQDPDARGIRYEVGEDGRVMAVHAGGPSIQLVEGCS